jgi:phospholipid transport system substrate-binding protein
MIKFISFLYILSLVFIPTDYCLASTVQDQLEGSINELLEILKDPALKGEDATQERREALRKVIYERFNFAIAARLSLGKNWAKHSEEEKKIFVGLFGKLLEQTYAEKIESYTDEKVEFLRERIAGSKAQVNTKLFGNDTEILIDYRLYKDEDGVWRIFDIVVEGVSLVNNYRSQFTQILQRDDFGKLIEELKIMTKE